MTFQKASSSGWMRFAQIGLGILGIILSGAAIASPGLTLLSIVVLVSVVLFFVGIEKIITGLFMAYRSRFATIGLGVLTIKQVVLSRHFSKISHIWHDHYLVHHVTYGI